MALAASAQELTWDLSDLYHSPADPRIDQDLEASRMAAEGLAGRYRGRVVTLSPQDLRVLLEDYESLLDRLYRPTTYASLCFAADTADQTVQALLARTREHAIQTMTRLQFLDIELKTAPEETFAAWQTSAVLTRYRHFLGALRRYAPHTLGEAEERILALKSLTGVSAWVQLFDETVAQIRVPLEVNGARRELTLDEVRALRSRPERELRKWVLTSNDDTLTAEDLALGYKQLLRVEQCWRTMKSGLRMRPVYHWTERRIRAHVLLCVLALLLERVAEIRSGDTWRNVAAKLETIKVVEYQRAQTRVRLTLASPNARPLESSSGPLDTRRNRSEWRERARS